VTSSHKFLPFSVLPFLLGVALILCGCSPVSKPTALERDRFQTSGIIGGKKADGTEPFSKTIVALFDTQRGMLCTASILSESTLVTAAHCFTGPSASWRIIFGTDIRAESRVMRPIVSYLTTPMWPVRGDEPVNSGDIAVVRFDGGLPEGYRPVGLLEDTSVLATNSVVMLAGYGVEDGVQRTGSGILRFVETTLLDPNYSETEMSVDQSKGRGACHGDSGGPAYVKVGDAWMLWGVTNHGINDTKDNCSTHASYALIPFYKNWIARAVKILTGKGHDQGTIKVRPSQIEIN
jgi:hypothetical protein